MVERVAVIGGGPAGCGAAHRLTAAGRDVVLFEREDEVGGRTRSWRNGDAVIDSGAGFFTNFYPSLAELITATGLDDEVVTLSRANTLVHDGEVAPLSMGVTASFLQFPFVSMGGKLRMAAHTASATARHRSLDLSSPESLAPFDDRSITDEAVAVLGREVYEFLIRPGIEPFWYFACEDVSRSLFLALHARAATARFFTLRDGMGSLAPRLAQASEVRTATAVERVERAPGGGALVDGEAFDAAIVATTASTATRIAGAALPDPVRDFVAGRTYVANTHAAFRIPRADAPPESARFPCGPGEHVVAAVACNSHKQQGSIPDDEEIVSVFLGAAASAELAGEPADVAAGRAWELGRVFCPELPEDAELVAAIARAEAIPVHAVGSYREAAAAQAAQEPPVAVAGDHLATATVDGALASGRRAADLLLSA